MTFDTRLNALRQQKGRTSFSFKFSELFPEQEWIDLDLSQRKYLEREFRRYIHNHEHLRIPYVSEDNIRMRMYNLQYDYNEIKANFKAYI